MAQFTKYHKKLINVIVDSYPELVDACSRIEAYSNHPVLKDTVFTLGYLKKLQAEEYGFSVNNTMLALTFPLDTLEPFKSGLFAPLTVGEAELINAFRSRELDDTVIIVTVRGDESALRHEMSHAFFQLFSSYKKAVLNLLKGFNVKQAAKILREMRYDEKDLTDEIVAYLIDGGSIFTSSGMIIDPVLLHNLNTVYLNTLNKHCKL